MSLTEVERFAEDLKTNPTLLAGVKRGARLSVPEAVKIGTRHGYRFSVEDAKAFIKARAMAAGRPLSDAQLDRVAAGAVEVEASELDEHLYFMGAA